MSEPSGHDNQTALDVEAVRELMRDAMRWVKPPDQNLRTRVMAGIKSLVTEFQYGGNVEERRRSVRLTCDFGVVCQVDDRRFKASVVNIGLPGMQMLIPVPLRPGGRVQVTPGEQADKSTVTCLIKWRKPEPDGSLYRVGVVFEGTPSALSNTWVPGLLSRSGFCQSMVYQRRHAVRARARIPGEVSVGDKTLEVVVHNLSLGGALLAADRPVEHGGSLELTFDAPGRTLTLPGSVVNTEIEDSLCYVGVKFARLSSVQTQRLGALVATLLKTER